MNPYAPRLPVLIMLTALSVAVGFLAARSRPAPVAAETATVAVEAPPPDQSPATEAGVPTVSKPEARAPLTPKVLRDRLDEIARDDRFGIRRYQYLRLLETMTAEEAPALLAELLKVRRPKDRDILFHFYFTRWGEVDGPSAVQAAGELGGRERTTMTASAYAGWSRAGPEEAWELTVALADDWPAFAGHAGRVLDQLVRRDMMGAINRRGDISNQRGEYAVQRAIINYAAEEGRLDTVLAAALGFDDIESKKQWVTNIFSSWGETESEAPLAALSGIADPVLAQSAMSGFLNGWARVDPMGAVDYVLAHREEPMVGDSLRSVVQQALVGGDRERTVELIERVAAIGELDNVAPAMISRVAFADPTMALKIAGMLSDEQQKSRYTGMAMSAWAHNDYKSAVAHFEQMPHSETKVQAMRSLAYSTLDREDGGSTVTRWVQALPEGPDRIQAMNHLIQSANSPQLNLSASSLEALQELARTTPGLPEELQEMAKNLSPGASEPTPPGVIIIR